MSKPLILITGGTGFVGAHIIWELLIAGYPVRAAVRSSKVADVKARYPEFAGQFEAVEIDDIATGDFSKALEGVEALIHAASPLPFNNEPTKILESAIEGTINVLKQAVSVPTIKRIVVTSSVVSLYDPDGQQMFQDVKIDHNSWSNVTYEEAMNGTHDAAWAYSASKPLAERKVWEIAAQHPNIDFTTVNPPFIVGYYGPRHPLPKTQGDLGTNVIVYSFLTGQFPAAPPFLINVKDIARAHILALTAPASPASKPKRLFVSLPKFSWADVAAIIRTERPELKERVPDPESYVPPPKVADWDTNFATELLGIRYIPLKETVLDCIDQLVDWEKRVKA